MCACTSLIVIRAPYGCASESCTARATPSPPVVSVTGPPAWWVIDGHEVVVEVELNAQAPRARIEQIMAELVARYGSLSYFAARAPRRLERLATEIGRGRVQVPSCRRRRSDERSIPSTTVRMTPTGRRTLRCSRLRAGCLPACASCGSTTCATRSRHSGTQRRRSSGSRQRRRRRDERTGRSSPRGNEPRSVSGVLEQLSAQASRGAASVDTRKARLARRNPAFQGMSHAPRRRGRPPRARLSSDRRRRLGGSRGDLGASDQPSDRAA